MTKRKNHPTKADFNNEVPLKLNMGFEDAIKAAMNINKQTKITLSKLNPMYFGDIPKGTKSIIIHDIDFSKSNANYINLFNYQRPYIANRNLIELSMNNKNLASNTWIFTNTITQFDSFCIEIPQKYIDNITGTVTVSFSFSSN